MFLINIVPKDNEMRFFVTGYNVANFSYDKTGLKAYIRKGNTMEPLDLIKGENYFVLRKSLMRPTDLRIKVNSGKTTEELDFTLR